MAWVREWRIGALWLKYLRGNFSELELDYTQTPLLPSLVPAAE